MKALRLKQCLGAVVAVIAAAVLPSASVAAQCAMCRAALDGANGATMAKSLNQGIIVLLIPPVAIFCAIFITAYRQRKAPGGLSKNVL